VPALIDVCILVAAHRADHPHHNRALEAVDAAAGSGFLWCAHTRNGFLRLVTDRRIFDAPTPTPVALAAWQTWVDRPDARLLLDSVAANTRFGDLCRARAQLGNAVYDLQLAALAMTDGVELWSFDDDFAAIPALRFRRW